MLGAKHYAAATHAPILIFPNPLNPKKYVVLNSGFTFREADYLSNARQTPKLPDYAIVDITTPPDCPLRRENRAGRLLQRGLVHVVLLQFLQALKSGEKTAADLLEICLRRIALGEREIRAWVEVSPQFPLCRGTPRWHTLRREGYLRDSRPRHRIRLAASMKAAREPSTLTWSAAFVAPAPFCSARREPPPSPPSIRRPRAIRAFPGTHREAVPRVRPPPWPPAWSPSRSARRLSAPCSVPPRSAASAASNPASACSLRKA